MWLRLVQSWPFFKDETKVFIWRFICSFLYSPLWNELIVLCEKCEGLYSVLVQKSEFLSRKKVLVLGSLNLVLGKMPIQKVDTILFVASGQLLQLWCSAGLSGHLKKLTVYPFLAVLLLPPNFPFCLCCCSGLPKYIKRSLLGLLRERKMLWCKSASRGGKKKPLFPLSDVICKRLGKNTAPHDLEWDTWAHGGIKNLKLNKSQKIIEP